MKLELYNVTIQFPVITEKFYFKHDNLSNRDAGVWGEGRLGKRHTQHFLYCSVFSNCLEKLSLSNSLLFEGLEFPSSTALTLSCLCT